MGNKDDYKTWPLPHNLLTHVSPYFAAALNGDYSETTLQNISFPEDDPKAFETFTQWLYIGLVIVRSPYYIPTYVHAWALGDKLGCVVFQDCVMAELVLLHAVGATLIPSTVKLAYELSPAGSKLRKWALKHFIYKTSEEESEQDISDCVSLAKATNDFAMDYFEESLNATEV